MDRSPLQAGPLLHVVVRTDHDDDKVGLFVIKLRQIDAEVAPRELGFVIFVVEDRLLSEAFRENGRDLRDIVRFSPAKENAMRKRLALISADIAHSSAYSRGRRRIASHQP
ncbi:MAG: hypothetical protein ACRD1T_08450 [Acidimicrobiia bacterium]